MEALHGGFGDGGPPDCAAVVDEHVEAVVGGEGKGDEGFDAGVRACVDGDGCGFAACFADFAGDGGYGGGGGVGVRREGGSG